MPRVYSKTGCQRCKSRKKRCGEERPVCSSCAKWGWHCVYEISKSRAQASTSTLASASVSTTALVTLEVSSNSSAATARLLPEVVQYCKDQVEGNVLKIVPELMAGFFSPTAASDVRELHVMKQLLTRNELLRNACIACFTVVIGKSAALDRTNQVTYGKALQSLRPAIEQVGSDQETTICVMASVLFLGIMESLGPHASTDVLEHWRALVVLLGNLKVVKLYERGVLPVNEIMFIIECALYNFGTLAIFSKSTERAWHLWTEYKIYHRLCTLNPDNSGRLNRSSTLYGQYSLYNLAFRVTYLSQYYPDAYIPSDIANEMETLVRYSDTRLDDDFAAALTATTNVAKHSVECAIYHLFSNSILIFITALRTPSTGQRLQMKHLVSLGMDMFLKLPSYGDDPQLSDYALHFMLAAIWPIEILACAMYDLEQFQTFICHYAILERFVDAGHQKRVRALLGQVFASLTRLRTEKVTDTAAEIGRNSIPVGLGLLRHTITMSDFEPSVIDSQLSVGPWPG